MLHRVLTTPLREKAGADIYNRYEYQVGWVVFHVLEKVRTDQLDFLILCEFHDDVAEVSPVHEPSCLQFYQIKTKSRGQWTLDALLKRDRGVRAKKHSFLGYLFYNFLTFSTECERCIFVSNRDFDQDLRAWAAVVEDGLSLEECRPDIYTTLMDSLRLEFPEEEQGEFERTMRRFANHTLLQLCPLQLEDYKRQIKGLFFDVSERFDIHSRTAHRVIRELWDQVRQKMSATVTTPISYHRLIEAKGLTGDVLKDLKMDLNQSSVDHVLDAIRQRFSKRPVVAALLVAEARKARAKRLDIDDSIYQDLIEAYIILCDAVIVRDWRHLDDMDFAEQRLNDLVREFLAEARWSHPDVTEIHLRGAFYERLFAGLHD